MDNLADIATVNRLFERHGMKFSKALGQNFLVNPSVCPRMAQLALPDSGMAAIEIGPGIGVLTRELSLRAEKVAAFEIDTRLLPILGETLDGCTNVEVINADVLKSDLSALIDKSFPGMRTVVCANLPYYITSPVIMLLLESRLPLESITVMVQKEAADRLCARVGSREAGAVTVAVDYYAQAKRLFDVSRGSFMPEPKVDSTVIQLTVRKSPCVDVGDERLFFAMVKAAFAQRRKTALNGISAGLGLDKKIIAEAIAACSFDAGVRAETLTMEQLAALSRAINSLSR